MKTNNLDKKRWFILILCCFVNLCIGSIYAWSVFAGPMEERLNSVYAAGLAVGALAIVFTIANAVGPIAMIPGGRINDKIGPRWIVLVGGLLFGGGYILSGFASSLPMLILTYSIMSGFGLALVYGCNINNCVKLFPDKRGLIGGLTTASYGLSSVIVPPIANALIQSIGVAGAFRTLGIAFLIIICVSSMFMVRPPADYRPASMPAPEIPNVAQTADGPVIKTEFAWREMMGTKRFWLMIFTLLCGGLSGMMCISQASAISQNMMGLTAATAALAVSVIALFNAGGRILSGFVSDRIGRTGTLMGAFILAAAGLLCLYIAGHGILPLFYCGFCLIGLSFGTFMGVYPAFTADQFGARNNSVNYGIMFCGFAASGYLGPTIMYKIFGAQGTYLNAFLIAELFVIAGFILLIILKKTIRNAN